MRRRTLLTAALPAALLTRAAEAAPATVALDGVDVRLRASTRQVVTAKHTGGHSARLTWWVEEDGQWEDRLQTLDGRTGYGGLVPGRQRQQGTGTTPLGTYDLPAAFGQVPEDPAWRLRYRQVRPGDFWVQDNASAHYNRLRNQRQGGFRWWLPSSDPDSSERLSDYRTQYEWAIVTGFNAHQVRHRGSGIFLHVNGSGATAGCVSAPRPFIRALMHRLDPARRPVIAIGR
jgi:L,D-peptidoglycan transpeptidase YkuD (ErfK/YbiS/YcfS/YnhG family)